MAFGLTINGFVAKRQSQIQSEIQDSLRSAFGQNINLLPESVFGQIVGIFSERESLVWELSEAVYSSQYPGGAEGVSVDNILALNALKRLAASPSRANVFLYGTPGTLIPAGSLIHVDGSATDQFSTDSDATIAAAIDCVQTVLFTAVPTSGHFKLSIVDPGGVTRTTGFMEWDDVAADLQTLIQALTGYGDATVTGSFTTGFTITFTGDSGEQPQNLMVSSANTLSSGSAVNVGVLMTTEGALAEIEVGVTCINTGPTYAPAGTLTEIDSAITGWESVNNPEDADVGTNTETDTEALLRRSQVLASNATGSLQGITAKVRGLDNVNNVVGFENTSIFQDFSTQFIDFSAIPTAGQFQIRLGGSPGDSTSLIDYNDTAADWETAIQAISGYEDVTVTGNITDGFVITFPVNFFGQPPALITNSTLVSGMDVVESEVSGGRPAKSFEIVVDGGDDDEIAQKIFDNKPAGIASFGNTGPIIVVDEDGFEHDIFFSRPTLVPIYIDITLDTNASFPADGVTRIQDEIVAIGEALTIGETVIVRGSDGLVGAFNDIPGITDYVLLVGKTASPSLDDNIPMQPEQRAQILAFNITVTVN